VENNATGAEERIWFLNSLMTVCRSSASGRDGVSVIEFRAPYGDAPPTHVHHHDDEIFHLIEGRMRFRVGNEEFVLEAGQSAVAPKGIPHAFRVESPEGARGLNIMAGANFENFVRAMGRPARTSGLPEPSMPAPDEIERLKRTASIYAMTVLGPPMS
jgi:mannose-6-phosphate isomerase-like protein (cupin superfamily)